MVCSLGIWQEMKAELGSRSRSVSPYDDVGDLRSQSRAILLIPEWFKVVFAAHIALRRLLNNISRLFVPDVIDNRVLQSHDSVLLRVANLGLASPK